MSAAMREKKTAAAIPAADAVNPPYDVQSGNRKDYLDQHGKRVDGIDEFLHVCSPLQNFLGYLNYT